MHKGSRQTFIFGRGPRLIADDGNSLVLQNHAKENTPPAVRSKRRLDEVSTQDSPSDIEQLRDNLVGLHSFALELQTQISVFHRNLSTKLVNIINERAKAEKRKRGISLCLRQLDSEQFGLDENLGTWMPVAGICHAGSANTFDHGASRRRPPPGRKGATTNSSSNLLGKIARRERAAKAQTTR